MIIGITGKMGSGKSTISEYIKSIGFEEYSFSTPLKQIGEILDFSSTQLYGSQEQKLEIHPHWNISSREFLQKVGTDLFRDMLPIVIPNMKIRDSIWIELFRIKYNRKRTNYVISDVRFLDEAKAIRDMGGIIFKTIRKNEVISKDGSENKHISENELESIEYNLEIDNENNSKEEAFNIVKKYLSGISFL